MLSDYLPILLLFLVSAAFALGSVGVSSLVGPNRPNPTKLSAYECGNEPLANVRGTRFSVKFYMVAVMFLIFDIETVFLYPWAVTYRSLGWFGLVQMMIFLGILGVAFVFEIGRGALRFTGSDRILGDAPQETDDPYGRGTAAPATATASGRSA